MTDSPRRAEVGVYGGSFDPPHVGHVLAVSYALAVGAFSRLVVVPVFVHAFDKELVPYDHRVAMSRLAFAGMDAVRVSRIEERLGAPSRSLRTVEALALVHPGAALRLVVGSDVLAEKESWYAWDELVRRAPPFVLGRAGAPHPDAPAAVLPEVSSTDLRTRLRGVTGGREADPELSRLVPAAVLRYIDAQDLYR